MVDARSVAVLLPLPLVGAYDYACPDDLDLEPGAFVRVPLGPRELTGVVWGAGEGTVDPARLRPVAARLDAPPMPARVRALVDWAADYTLAAPGAVLRMAMSMPDALQPPRPLVAYAAGPRPARMTPQRERVYEVLKDGPPRSAVELAREAGVGTAVVQALAREDHLVAVRQARGPSWIDPDPALPGPVLSDKQALAAAELKARVGEAAFSTTLLDGITGSGKTEVYFEAIAAALAVGRQALVLLPEIALGAQWLDRFETRFGARPALWHSELGQARRRDTWRAVAEGRVRVLVGARSALFLPFAELGLIVVDEEHDASYKQEDGVIYNARDMAVVSGRLGAFPVILASATPSIESRHNVMRERYRCVHLPDRHGPATLPEIRVVDMRADPPPRGAWLSPPLVEAVRATAERGEQTLLFLNRRGYAPLTLCRHCGHRFGCPRCSAWLVEHRLRRDLRCHHCGWAQAIPKKCPSCATADSLAACGPGVERLAEEIAGLAPDLRVRVTTSDTVAGPEAAAELVAAMNGGEIDVLIGTQIIAKGYHFPNLTLVGAVDADLGLAGGDLRAAERTYQLLAQVSGRAGREERPGTAILQSYMPEHPVIAALLAGDRERFVETELAERRRAGLPPFGRLAALIVSGAEEPAVAAHARALAAAAPSRSDMEVLGPAPAPMVLLRARYRYRLLIRAARTVDLPAVMRAWLATVKRQQAIRVQVDIDPYSFL